MNTSGPWPDLDTNMAGWRGLVAAARASGLRNIPDPIASTGPPLTRPASGQIEDTTANRSEGAHTDPRGVRQPEPPLSAAGRRDRRPLDGCGGRLPDGSDGHRTDRRGFVIGEHDRHRRRDGSPERRDGSLGRRDRHCAAFASCRSAPFTTRPPTSRPRDLRSFPPTPSATGSPRSSRASSISTRPPIKSASSRWAFRASSPPLRTSPRQGSIAAGATTGPNLAAYPAGPLLLVTQSAGAGGDGALLATAPRSDHLWSVSRSRRALLSPPIPR